MRMEVDALDYVIEKILSTDYGDRLVAYLSESLNEIEKNYEIYDKKILVVIRRLKN